MTGIIVAALYKFAPLRDLPVLRRNLLSVCKRNKVLGTLLLADEGINGTIAGDRAGIDAVLDHIRSIEDLMDIDWKESFASAPPFHRMKVHLKKEIVTIGLPEVDPVQHAGTYVAPEDWNSLISDPDTVLIDTRNDYEVEIGTFKNAVNPETQSFRSFPAWVKQKLSLQKDKKVAMFCTGGIRCEKASAYMKQYGFDEVYHLKGGILKYLETVPESQSLWEGACFVFDQRVAVTHGLKEATYDMCFGCRFPVSENDKQSVHYIEGVSCPRCHDKISDAKKAGAAERHKQAMLAEARGEKHIGAMMVS